MQECYLLTIKSLIFINEQIQTNQRMWFSHFHRINKVTHNWPLSYWLLSDRRCIKMMLSPTGSSITNAQTAATEEKRRLNNCVNYPFQIIWLFGRFFARASYFAHSLSGNIHSKQRWMQKLFEVWHETETKYKEMYRRHVQIGIVVVITIAPTKKTVPCVWHETFEWTVDEIVRCSSSYISPGA